jgi:hypothetical protein
MVRVALLALTAACAAACAPTAGAMCATDTDCPGAGLVCSAGTCTDPGPVPAPEVITGPAQFPLEPGSTPRVIARGDGGIDVLFAVAECGGIARWRPLDGGGAAVIALAGNCVHELDANRGADGTTHIIAGVLDDQTKPQGATHAMAVDVTDAGRVIATLGPFSSSDAQILPRIALDGAGSVAAWTAGSETLGMTVDEFTVAPPSAPSSPPALASTLIGASGGGLALSVDAGKRSLAYADGNGLELVVDGASKRRIAEKVSGPIDSVSCAGALTIAFRGVHDDKLLVATASSDPARYLPDAFDGLPPGRAPGDVALACDRGQQWIAHVVAGDGALRIASFDGGAAWHAAAPDLDALGAVSLAVKDGSFHAAYAGPDGLVRYAASR